MSDYNDGLVPEPCLRLDYGFGQQYASVELGDGTGYVRVSDDLRSEHHKMKRWYDDELRAALDENAKLRELVWDMWRFTGAACKKYPRLFDHVVQGGQMMKPNMIDAFEQRMRELGVEVEL